MPRPDIDPALPRYYFKFFRRGKWWKSRFEMTIPYAAKQYADCPHEPLMETERYLPADYDAPWLHMIGTGHGHFQRGFNER